MSTTQAKRTRTRSGIGLVDDVTTGVVPYVLDYLVVAGGGGVELLVAAAQEDLSIPQDTVSLQP